MSNKLQQAKLILAAGSPYSAGSIKLVKPIGTDATVVRAGATATRVNSAGLIELVGANEPRLDWLDRINGGVATCPNWLVEDLSENICLHTADFSNAAWIKSTNVTPTYNAAVAPDGTTTADLFTTNAGIRSGDNAIVQTRTVTAGEIYTASFQGESAGYDWGLVQVVNGALNSLQWGNTTTGAAGTFSGTPVIASGVYQDINGYYRIYITFQAVTTGNCEIAWYSTLADGSASFTAVGGLGHYLWGANLATGILTSYIPSVATAVTRNADVITVAVPSGVSEIVTTFDDDTTQIVTSISSTFTLPFGRIKSVVML